MLKYAAVVLWSALILCLAGCDDALSPDDSGPTIDPDGPRATFETYRSAMRSGDLENLKSVLAEEARGKIEQAPPDMVLGMLKSLVPTEEEITAVEIDGDSAVIRLAIMNGEAPADGRVEFAREDGKWKVVREHIDLGGGAAEEHAPDETEHVDLEPDGDWNFGCNELEITAEPAAGRIGGAPFTVRFANIQNNILTLTDGDNFRWGGRFMIFLFLHEDDKSLAGRTVVIGPEKDWEATVNAHVHIGYEKEGGGNEMEAKTEGFSLRLEFGEETDGKLPGQIHLSYPDEKKSYVVGSFTATVE